MLSFSTQQSWREWLDARHTTAAGAWLQFAKVGSGKKSITYAEAIEVALCYGWIDGQAKRVDDASWAQKFTPRGARSIWSKINCGKAEALIKSGAMQPAGLAAIERAKQDGRWTAAYAGSRTITVPDDLQAALDRNRKAAAFFTTLNSKNRYAILFRIHNAKKAETRARRIEQFVQMLAKHETIYAIVLISLACLTTLLTACGGGKSPQAPSPQPPGQGTPTLSVPVIVSPSDDQTLDTVRPELRVRNVTSDQPGTRTYDFQVSRDGSFDAAASLIVNKSGVAEAAGSDGTAYRVEQDLQTSTRYFWRARAMQGSTAGGWSGTGRFKTVANVPPVIVSIAANPARAEIDTEVELTATVEDRETRTEDLTFEWSADKGTFTSTSTPSKVRWRAPRNEPTPVTYDLRLTVVERYTAPREDGSPGEEPKEHRVNGSTRIRVNDSRKEITDLVLTFLDDFAHSNVSPETCVRNFSDSCRGKQDELSDIRNGRARAESISSNFHVTDVRFNGDRNFADITAPCEFVSRLKENGKIETAKGTCTLTSIYEDGRWWLCDSHFSGTTTSGLRFWF